MIARTLATAAVFMVTGALLGPDVAKAASPASTATPKTLSLTLQDVQHVYGATFRPFMVNSYKASPHKTCGADYTGGYLTMFGNFQKAGKAGGVVSITSSVFAFPTQRSAACASQSHGTSLAKVMNRPGTTVHVSPLSGVGDSAYLFTVSSKVDSSKRGNSVMIWLARGTHIAMVMVSAVGSSPAPSGAIALAKIIDGRIQVGG
jgi:hypothetical protein